MPVPLLLAGLYAAGRSALMSPPVQRSLMGLGAKWTGRYGAGAYSKPVQGLAAMLGADVGRGAIQEAGEDVFNYAADTNIDIPEATPAAFLGAKLEEAAVRKAKEYGLADYVASLRDSK